MSSDKSRRRFLETAGIAGVAALAGCSGNGGGDSDGSDGDSGYSGDSGEDTPTETDTSGSMTGGDYTAAEQRVADYLLASGREQVPHGAHGGVDERLPAQHRAHRQREQQQRDDGEQRASTQRL
jgi:hypothetical protein